MTWSLMANWMLISPTTPKRSASSRAMERKVAWTDSERENGGVQQAESPEWMPAISMCSRMAPT